MPLRVLSKASEDIAGTLVESDSDTTNCKLQLPLKQVFKPPSNMGSEIKRALADFGLVTKPDVDAIVRNCLTNWTSLPQWQIINAVEATFHGAIKAIYSNLIKGLNSTMFNVHEQALGKVVQSVH